MLFPGIVMVHAMAVVAAAGSGGVDLRSFQATPPHGSQIEMARIRGLIAKNK